jgi:dipeptidyl aminopeptidase/acylaminoacyl peptidase
LIKKLFGILVTATYFLLAIPLSAVTTSASASGKSPVIPIEAFAAPPTYSNPKLSPSGRTIAHATNYKGKTAIVFQNLNGEKGLIIPPLGDTEILNFRWANEDVLILETLGVINRAKLGGTNLHSRILTFNRKTGKLLWLGKPKNTPLSTQSNSREKGSFSEIIVGMLPDDPDHILVQFDFNFNGNSETYKVNVRNAKRTKIEGEQAKVFYWDTDHSSNVRLGLDRIFVQDSKKDQPEVTHRISLAYTHKPEFKKSRVVLYKKPDGKWLWLSKFDWFKKYDVVGFSPEPSVLYISGPTEFGTKGLFKLDVPTAKVIGRIFAKEGFDLEYVQRHPITGHIIAASYVDDFRHVQYFDKDLAKVQRSIDRALKGTINSIVSRARDRDLYVLKAADDKNPGDFYLFDREKGQMHFIAPARRLIDPKQSAATQRVTIPVRDGSSISGYLSIPADAKPNMLPTIILPHDGPEARSTATWDWWAQFYTSRGYAVLKPNFRGSNGFGTEFLTKGHNQWGGLMQDDITDATRWVIDQGIADPSRICIVGTSYGGYTALMGAIKEPNLYKCAISINGLTDIVAQKFKTKTRRGGAEWAKTIGLEGTDDSQVSPYQRAKDIKAPVLLVSTKNDDTIHFSMAKNMHKRLKKLKKRSTYVELKDGGHAMRTTAARIKMLRETEKFLAKYIGD